MKTNGKILYFGWTGHANLGDEILLEIFRQETRAALGPGFGVDSFEELKSAVDPAGYSVAVLGGGSILTLNKFVHPAAEWARLGRPLLSWGSAVDALFDCGVEEFGARFRVTEPLHSDLKAICEKAAYLSVRGEYSKVVLEKLGANPEQISISLDPALLMEVPPAGREPPRRIAVNFGTACGHAFGDETQTHEALRETLSKLSAEGCELWLFAMWPEDIPSLQKLAAELPKKPEMLPAVPTGAELVSLLSGCELTIAYKLHAAVLSAAALTPFVSLAYRGKCFEFAHSIGTPELVIRHDRVTPGILLDKISYARANRESLRLKFENARSTAAKKAEQFRARLRGAI